MHTLRHEILPPSGIEFAACLRLTPSTVSSAASSSTTPKALYNIVVARSSLIRIFEVREEPIPISQKKEDERERRASVRKGTEAVEGEVEMDGAGEGYVNVGIVKSSAQDAAVPPVIHRVYLLREHHLHGIVTGMEGVRTMSSVEDGLDRLLVSFKDAKIALLEWSLETENISTVSIHTYERAPQLAALDASLFSSMLRSDPLSRCAALLLPKDSIAVLPFYQTQVDLDVMEQDTQARDIPYSPSFILDFAADVDERIRHVIDFVFLPGFHSPTIAVLFQRQQTWTGRLKEYKDTVGLFIFTLDLVTHNCPIITTVENLPYDSLYLTACSSALGGVVIITANSIIHVDQTSRRMACAVNGWVSRVSDITVPPITPNLELQLEGSRAEFVDDKTLFVILKDGTVYPVEIGADGRTVSHLSITAPVAMTTVPTIVRRVQEDFLFIGSIVGPSVLLKAAKVDEEIPEDDVEMETSPVTVVDTTNPMDIDDDDDIYGPVQKETKQDTNGASNGVVVAPKRTRTVVHLSLCDSIPTYGPISDITFAMAKNGDRLVPELVAATGSGPFAGFTLFQRDLPTRVKRKLHAIGGGRGVWSLPVRQTVKINGSTYEKPTNLHHAENDSVIISTDANPSPGLSRIAQRSPKSDIAITTRLPGTTIGAAPFFQGTAILHVMSNYIRVLEPDGTQRQEIKDLDGNMPRPKIRYCSISDPFILIIREDDSLGLFIGEPERGKIRRKDMSPMGEKTSKYIAGCFYADTSGIFQSKANATAEGLEKTVTTLQGVVTAGSKSQWLLLVRPQGVMEIWTLPKLTLIFSTGAVSMLDSVLVDSGEAPALSLPQDPPRKPQELDIEQIVIAPLGESSPRPHLLVFLRSGHFAIYEAVSSPIAADQSPPATRAHTLLVKFVKVLSRSFDIQPHMDEGEKSVLAEQKRISRHLIPFVTSPAPGQSFSGVFLTGDRPSWIIATDKGGIRIHASGHSVVHAFTACSLWESKGDFLLYSEEGPSLLEWIPNMQLDNHLPSRSIPKDRVYSNVVYESTSSLLVAASSQQARFASYDDDGNILWEPDAPNISYPMCETSTLELISPETWLTMDGHEFGQNEFVTCIACIPLESTSTDTGVKDFIVVGTTINRGEDLAVKGAVYIFEVVEVVPDSSISPRRWYRLKLLCRDDAKGPVTAVCGMNGYLVSSMGQKIFVRAFDLDERLVGVAFLDVGVYVTSLRATKNLLVIGDAVKSVWFVAFQEDPYKLVVLAKDVYPVCVTQADLFFADGRVSIVSCDEEGIVRVYEYDPHNPESKGGQRLLCQTEFHGQTEYRTSYVIARRPKNTGSGLDSEIPQAKLICGGTDGTLSSLTYVDEAAFKRLHLLQGQLTRNMQHTAGLNPKAFRIVHNDRVARPLTKGILDGNLLSAFEDLPIGRQDEVTRQIATERAVVMRDWVGLGGAW